jgi:hypothetical protein
MRDLASGHKDLIISRSLFFEKEDQLRNLIIENARLKEIPEAVLREICDETKGYQKFDYEGGFVLYLDDLEEIFKNHGVTI